MHTHVTAEAAAETSGALIRQAGAYDALVGALMLGRAGRMRQRIVEAMDPPPGAAVLDAGCGTGDLALALARRLGSSGSVVGIDASPEMVARARAKARRARLGADFRVAAVESLPFADGAFDQAAFSLVLHHLPGDLKRWALASVARVLKPGGLLTVVDFLAPDGRIQRHGEEAIERGSLEEWLRAAGFGQARSEVLRFPSLAPLLGWPPLTITRARQVRSPLAS